MSKRCTIPHRRCLESCSVHAQPSAWAAPPRWRLVGPTTLCRSLGIRSGRVLWPPVGRRKAQSDRTSRQRRRRATLGHGAPVGPLKCRPPGCRAPKRPPSGHRHRDRPIRAADGAGNESAGEGRLRPGARLQSRATLPGWPQGPGGGSRQHPPSPKPRRGGCRSKWALAPRKAPPLPSLHGGTCRGPWAAFSEVGGAPGWPRRAVCASWCGVTADIVVFGFPPRAARSSPLMMCVLIAC